ncbi:Uncharacterized protein GBIM_02871 [Gryllus bimaculatus]|nr:Uncharacterized protein GBIM_02871 [Gryllus bimaculatus]
MEPYEVLLTESSTRNRIRLRHRRNFTKAEKGEGEDEREVEEQSNSVPPTRGHDCAVIPPHHACPAPPHRSSLVAPPRRPPTPNTCPPDATGAVLIQFSHGLLFAEQYIRCLEEKISLMHLQRENQVARYISAFAMKTSTDTPIEEKSGHVVRSKPHRRFRLTRSPPASESSARSNCEIEQLSPQGKATAGAESISSSVCSTEQIFYRVNVKESWMSELVELVFDVENPYFNNESEMFRVTGLLKHNIISKTLVHSINKDILGYIDERATVAALIVLALLGCALAEPPVNRGYLPPQARFSAPSQQYGPPASGPARISAPSSQYGAPASGFARISAPSSQYGAPARNSAPSSQNGAPARISAPSQQYGAPARSSAPSTQYGAPARIAAPAPARFSAPSEQYGAPARFSAPSSQFGAPAAARFSSGPSRNNGFGAPSTQYGAPAAERFSAPAPAPVYGAPNAASSYSAAAARAPSRLSNGPAPEPANYEFQYAVEDYESGANFGHQEDRQDESAQGEYRVVLPDGRTQIVEYQADEEGYKPQIRYEEADGPYAASQGSRNGGNGGPY